MTRVEDPDPAIEAPSPAAPADKADKADKALMGIQEVASRLKVTHRTLRFYEDKGLIEPVRVGNTRVYSRKEVARMHLILRGKHLGFTIREIKEFLDLYDADPQHVEQSRLLLKRINERLRLLERQRTALDETMTELAGLAAETREQIARAEH